MISMDNVELKGYLRPVIIKLLSKEGEKTGSELANEIGEKIGSKPSYGSIYPILGKLKEKNLVNVKEKGKEKRYVLSEKGEKFVEEMDQKQSEFLETLRDILRTFDTIFEDEEIELMIQNLEEKSKTEGPYLPELSQIQYLLFTSENLEEEKGKIREELGRTLRNLKEILED